MKRALKAILTGLCALAFAFSGAVTAFAQEGAGAEHAAAQESAAPAAEAQAGSGAAGSDGASSREEELSLFLPSSP